MALLILLAVLLADLSYYSHAGYLALTKPAAAAGGRYREGILGQPRLINPLVGTSSADQALIHLVYSGLYKYDAGGAIVPDLAKNLPQISDDQKQYTIRLRDDARWHNGKAVTADDVLFTVRLMQDENFGSPYRSLWQNTVVEKDSDENIVFSNKDVSAPFIHNLTLPIMPQEIWSNVSASNFLLSSLNLEAVGSGPYTIREINKLPSGKIQTIGLESFSNYYAGKPHISQITLAFYDSYEELVSALHAKAIDGFGYVSLDTTLSLSEQKHNVTIYRLPLPQYQGAFFNLKNQIMSDKAVRNALAQATDASAIRSEVFADTGLHLSSPIVPEQLHKERAKTPTHATDIATAVSVLEQAGWKIDPATGIRTKNRVPLEFTITTNDFPLNARTAELLANQWKALNAKIKLNIVPTKDLTSQLLPNRQYDVLVFALKQHADPDPFIFWHSSQTKDPGLNITQFSNSEVDKLISDARNTTDFNVRVEKYNRFEQIINSEVPVIFLNQTVYTYAVSNSIKNVGLKSLYDPAFRFYDSSNWYIEERRVWK